MSFYIWVVPDSILQFANSVGGVSPCYALPVANLPFVGRLPGSCVYIIARAYKRDYLFARVIVDSVERCEDDAGNPLGFLINIDVASSCRFIHSCNDVNAADYATKEFASEQEGISEIPQASAMVMDQMLKARMPRLIRRFTEEVYSRINPPVEQCNSAFAAKVLLREIASQFVLSELWGSQRIPNPIAHVAVEFLKSHSHFISDGKVNDVISTLSAWPCLTYDATEQGTPKTSEDTSATQHEARMPYVDLSLVPINPREIKIRRFVARRVSISVEDMLQKTESAEKRHQEMLKDIASYLLANGQKVFQSESIDMAIKGESGLFVFELKSMRSDNAVSQIAKGFFQLLYYSDALTQCGVPVAGKALIVESNLTSEMADAFSRILGDAGISLYFYDSNQSWPNRLAPELRLNLEKPVTMEYSLGRLEDYDEAASSGDSAERGANGYDPST